MEARFAEPRQRGESSWKAVGAEMVLRTVENGNLWGKIKGFEVLVDGVGGKRYIDILLEIEGVTVRMEVKSWKQMYASTFIKQFIEKDLASIKNLNELRWVFDAKYAGMLKEDIIKVLKSNKGKAALNNLPEDVKFRYFPKLDKLIGITDTEIEIFINSNFTNIFIIH